MRELYVEFGTDPNHYVYLYYKTDKYTVDDAMLEMKRKLNTDGVDMSNMNVIRAELRENDGEVLEVIIFE